MLSKADGRAEIPLAQAIQMRHRSLSGNKLLSKPRAAALCEWRLDQLEREPNHLECVIDTLARQADLASPQPKLMNLNPIEFANSFRDDELHFLLARKLTKLS